MTEGAEQAALFADLAERLRLAQQRLGRAELPPETRGSLQERLIIITNSAKHGLESASRRLDVLLAELPENP